MLNFSVFLGQQRPDFGLPIDFRLQCSLNINLHIMVLFNWWLATVGSCLAASCEAPLLHKILLDPQETLDARTQGRISEGYKFRATVFWTNLQNEIFLVFAAKPFAKRHLPPRTTLRFLVIFSAYYLQKFFKSVK